MITPNSTILSEKALLAFIDQYDLICSDIGSMEIEDYQIKDVIADLGINKDEYHKHILRIVADEDHDCSFVYPLDLSDEKQAGSFFAERRTEVASYLVTRKPMEITWDPLDPQHSHQPFAVWWQLEAMLLAENGHQLHLNFSTGDLTFTLDFDEQENQSPLHQLVITADEKVIRYSYREDAVTLGSLDVEKRSELPVTDEDKHRCFLARYILDATGSLFTGREAGSEREVGGFFILDYSEPLLTPSEDVQDAPIYEQNHFDLAFNELDKNAPYHLSVSAFGTESKLYFVGDDVYINGVSLRSLGEPAPETPKARIKPI